MAETSLLRPSDVGLVSRPFGNAQGVAPTVFDSVTACCYPATVGLAAPGAGSRIDLHNAIVTEIGDLVASGSPHVLGSPPLPMA